MCACGRAVLCVRQGVHLAQHGTTFQCVGVAFIRRFGTIGSRVPFSRWAGHTIGLSNWSSFCSTRSAHSTVAMKETTVTLFHIDSNATFLSLGLVPTGSGSVYSKPWASVAMPFCSHFRQCRYFRSLACEFVCFATNAFSERCLGCSTAATTTAKAEMVGR